MEAKYFVVSDGDEPDRILFSWEDAVKAGLTYIDAFDKDGNPVHRHQWDCLLQKYTTDF